MMAIDNDIQRSSVTARRVSGCSVKGRWVVETVGLGDRVDDRMSGRFSR
jgi:hypothetical protein